MRRVENKKYRKSLRVKMKVQQSNWKMKTPQNLRISVMKSSLFILNEKRIHEFYLLRESAYITVNHKRYERPFQAIFKQCVLTVLIECSVGLLYDTSINGPFMSVNAVGRDYGISAPALVIWKVVSPTSHQMPRKKIKEKMHLPCGA